MKHLKLWIFFENKELKFSQTAFNQMINLKSNSSVFIPFNEVIYDKTKIISGLIILDIFNKLFSKHKMINFKSWNDSNFFDYNFYEKIVIPNADELKLIINNSFKGIVNYDLSNIMSEGMQIKFKVVSTFEFKAEFSEFEMAINFNKNYLNDSKKGQILKHELRHITQYINTTLINIANNWIKESKNYDDLGFLLKRTLFVKSDKYWFGSGKTKKIDDSDLTGFQKYLVNNEEYKVWLSDIIDYAIAENNLELDYNKAFKLCWDWIVKNDKFKIMKQMRKEAVKDFWLGLAAKLDYLK